MNVVPTAKRLCSRLTARPRCDKDIGTDAERLCSRLAARQSPSTTCSSPAAKLGNKSRRSVCPFKLRFHSFSWNRTIRSCICLITRLCVSMIPTLRQRRKDNRGNHSISSALALRLGLAVTRTLYQIARLPASDDLPMPADRFSPPADCGKKSAATYRAASRITHCIFFRL